MFLIFGGWHLRFHMIKAQGTKYSFNNNWPQEKHRRFFFNNQVYDNMFHSLASGCTIWTSYEVITMWAFANNLIPFLSWEASPLWFIVLFLVIPIFRDAHFYLVHRLLHFKFLYKHVHSLHHKISILDHGQVWLCIPLSTCYILAEYSYIGLFSRIHYMQCYTYKQPA